MATIENLMDEATGKWSENISDIDYMFLKTASEGGIEDEKIIDNSIEEQLKHVDFPNEKSKKGLWLKKQVCYAISDPEIKKQIENSPIHKRKDKLLNEVMKFIEKALPIPGIAREAIVKIVVMLIKRALKKKSAKWCENIINQ